MPCSVCAAETTYAMGLCISHYRKWKFYGDVNFVREYKVTPLEDRFWEKVQKGEGCWLWAGGKTKAGYGVIQEGGRGSKHWLAHRLSYTINKGPIPEGLNVLHSCDNPSCVNPDHLRSGTYAENNKEAYDKRRKVSPFAIKENRYQGPRPSQPGESNPHARLTEVAVKHIRSCKDKPGILARIYNVTPDYVTMIRKRKVWKHVE